MRLGSWRDPEVARDVKVLAFCGALALFALVLPDGFAPFLAVLITLGVLAALLMHLRGGVTAFTEEEARR